MKEITITDIDGFFVGNAQDQEGGTGCTAILCPSGAVGGVDVRGGAPATRETDLLNPVNTVERIHCVMLSGGSAYGLAAADGAMSYLEERNIGFDVQVGVVPIVPSACLFDLVVGNPKCRPDREMGYQALVNAEKELPARATLARNRRYRRKIVGASAGDEIGLGIYAAQAGDVKVGAVVAVNALGNVVDHETGKNLAGLLNEEGTEIVSTRDAIYQMADTSFDVFRGNTTIGCIVTNAKLTKAAASKVASMAHNGYARGIMPVHTSNDGDTIFAMAAGEVEAMTDVVGTWLPMSWQELLNQRVLSAESAYGFLSAGRYLMDHEVYEQLKAAREPLLLWYDTNQRELPWRGNVSPYETWISEIMLQQTRVEAVKEYYRRFLERFPIFLPLLRQIAMRYTVFGRVWDIIAVPICSTRPRK